MTHNISQHIINNQKLLHESVVAECRSLSMSKGRSIEGAHYDHHQLSIINCPLSIVHCPLSIVHYPLLIAFCLLLSVNAMAQFGGGTGTENDPYKISSITHLNTLADNVNGGSYHYEGVYFKVTEDITSTAVSKVIGGGGGSKYFSGIFDGNNKRIKLGINITSEYSQYIGLFGYIKGATIKNVKVEGSLTSAKWYAGSIAGYATDDCVIENCSSSVTVTVSSSFAAGIVGNAYNTTITDCTNTGRISGTVNVGGISGTINGCTISNCSNTGVVTGASANWIRGGLFGSASSSDITNCSNTGNVTGTERVGGIVGTGEAIIVANCFNRGTVTGSASCIGGIVGKLLRTSSVKNCYNTGAISGGSANAVAGIVGQNNEAAQIQNCYGGNTISTSSSYKGGIVGEHYMGTIDHCYYRSGDGVSRVNYDNGGTATNSTSFTHTNGSTTCTLASSMYGTTVMLNALNAWVDAQPGNDYLNWAADNSLENRGMPIFHTCTPVTVSNFRVTEQGDRYVKIGWDAVANVTYTLYYGVDDPLDGWEVSSPANPFTAERLTNGRTYYFVVKPAGDGSTYCTDNPPTDAVSGTPNCP